MNPTTTRAVQFDWDFDDLSALNKCIDERWKLRTLNIDAEVPNCQLCILDDERLNQRMKSGEDISSLDCHSCIIYKDTRTAYCTETPYLAWWSSQSDKAKEEAAKAELGYLEDLRNRMLLADLQPAAQD